MNASHSKILQRKLLRILARDSLLYWCTA